jgi:hypothetical protein
MEKTRLKTAADYYTYLLWICTSILNTKLPMLLYRKHFQDLWKDKFTPGHTE